MSYILVDCMNTFFRAKHVVRSDDIEEKVGMAMTIMFTSINKAYRDFKGSHVVFCFEGSSWRKDFYAPYKLNRKEKRAARSQKEVDDDIEFFAAFEAFTEFVKNDTNATVLQADGCEADDFIARWTQTHPNDDHVIISSDSDFYQLISENVTQYNGVAGQHITLDGVFNDKGKPVMDNKTKEQKQIGDPEWLLFEKCVRGDTSDNIFSAYPGAPKKGTKNRIGMLDAFADRDGKGFNWNNFMLQRWVDHHGDEHVVRDDYTRNCRLVDLTSQPDEIKETLDAEIIEAVQAEHKGQVGIKLMRFCGKHFLPRIGERSTDHAKYLGASYANKAASN